MSIEHSENTSEKIVNSTKGEHHNRLVSEAYGYTMPKTNVSSSEHPVAPNNQIAQATGRAEKETTAVEDLSDAGRSMWDAVWKAGQAETKAVVGTAQTLGQLAMKPGQILYAENKNELASIVDGAVDVGNKMLSGAARVSQSLNDNLTHKPLTSFLEFGVNPLLPFMHASAAALGEHQNRNNS